MAKPVGIKVRLKGFNAKINDLRHVVDSFNRGVAMLNSFMPTLSQAIKALSPPPQCPKCEHLYPRSMGGHEWKCSHCTNIWIQNPEASL